jgi:hypothetical protein
VAHQAAQILGGFCFSKLNHFWCNLHRYSCVHFSYLKLWRKIMKKVATLSVLLLLLSVSFAADGKWSDCKAHIHDAGFMEDVTINFDDDALLISWQEEPDETVEITGDYELYVNGKHIRTNKHQKELLRIYYDDMARLVQEAERIGIQGAALGVKGAEMGVIAATKALKVIFTDYDSDEMEEELEREAEKLERKAKKLESRADKLEEMVEELEDTHRELKDNIEDLRNLDWF